VLYIQSKKCQRMPRWKGETCSTCLSLNTSSEVNRLCKRASGLMPITTNYCYYSYDQLYNTVECKNDEKTVYRLEVSHSILYNGIWLIHATASQSQLQVLYNHCKIERPWTISWSCCIKWSWGSRTFH
jgi:hypothetical protein